MRQKQKENNLLFEGENNPKASEKMRSFLN